MSLVYSASLFDDVSSCCVLVCFQLREDFDMGIDVVLDEEHSVHDVAALLKEFLRDMPDPLLPRELYRAFLHANRMSLQSQKQAFTNDLTFILLHRNQDTQLNCVISSTLLIIVSAVIKYSMLTLRDVLCLSDRVEGGRSVDIPAAVVVPVAAL